MKKTLFYALVVVPAIIFSGFFWVGRAFGLTAFLGFYHLGKFEKYVFAKENKAQMERERIRSFIRR